MRRVEPLHRVAEVFNITVDGEHEYYANGVLVSNCDAARYSYEALTHYLSKIPKPEADPGTAAAMQEEAERIENRMDKREQHHVARLAQGDEDYLDSLDAYNGGFDE